MIRVISPSLLIVACILTPRIALAQDVTLKDAIQCKDFKHNSDGSWYAKDVSLNYGPAGSQQQVNLSTVKYTEAADWWGKSSGFRRWDLPEIGALGPIFLRIRIGDSHESEAVILCCSN